MGNSAIGRGTAVEEQKVKASAADGSPGFLEDKVDDDTMIVNSNLLESVNEFKVGSFTKNIADATGSTAYTGIGFQPKAVIFNSAVNSSVETTYMGFSDGSTQRALSGRGAVGTDYVNVVGSVVLQWVEGLGPDNFTNGAITSFDSDGFTISYTKTGSPTGTATVQYIAFR